MSPATPPTPRTSANRRRRRSKFICDLPSPPALVWVRARPSHATPHYRALALPQRRPVASKFAPTASRRRPRSRPAALSGHPRLAFLLVRQRIGRLIARRGARLLITVRGRARFALGRDIRRVRGRIGFIGARTQPRARLVGETAAPRLLRRRLFVWILTLAPIALVLELLFHRGKN